MNIDKGKIAEAIEIVRKGRYEVTWYKEKADEYNKALDLLFSLSQAVLSGKLGEYMTEDDVKKLIKEYSNETPNALGDRWITLGAIDELSNLLVGKVRKQEER